MACNKNISEIVIEVVWIKYPPNAADKCFACGETIFSSIYSMGSIVNGKDLREIHDTYKVCASCLEGTELRIVENEDL